MSTIEGKLGLLVKIQQFYLRDHGWTCASLSETSVRMRHPDMGERRCWVARDGQVHSAEIV